MEAQKFILAAKPTGLPKTSDFAIEKEALKTLEDGEILCKAKWLTVDPYMRGRIELMKVGDQMPGEQIATVVESRCPDFPVGTTIVGFFGWRDMTVFKVPPAEQRGFGTIYKVPDMKTLPLSYALGSCGMPGNTAFFGLTKLCQPKKGETVVVSAAAGAVGSVVGQIAKIKGCRVIGFAGTDDKVEWLKELGFDEAFNYKTVDVDETLKKIAPEGVDCYFDNVGGEFSYKVVKNMNFFGRIALCGAIETYNRDRSELPLVPFDYGTFIYKQIRLEGFIVNRWNTEWFDALNQIRDWIIEGKIKVQETRREGFTSMSQAFIDLLQGKNTGKMIVKA